MHRLQKMSTNYPMTIKDPLTSKLVRQNKSKKIFRCQVRINKCIAKQ